MCGWSGRAPLVRHFFIQRAQGSQRVHHEGIRERNVPALGTARPESPSGMGKNKVAEYMVNVCRGQGWLQNVGWGGRFRALQIWILDFTLNEIKSKVEPF